MKDQVFNRKLHAQLSSVQLPFSPIEFDQMTKREHINDTKMLTEENGEKTPFILAFKHHLGNAAKKILYALLCV